jgi:NADP-dependent 3-hydroxy acid dehydrogenase YdfG
MRKVLIFGSGSKITEKLDELLNKEYKIKVIGRSSNPKLDVENLNIENITKELDEYDYFIFNIGLLYSNKISEQTLNEITSSFKVNLLYIVLCCEYLIEKNNKAKIFILGSESGKKGSYDTSYFLSKAAMRAYVNEKKIKYPNQQIVLFSPSVIEDSGMTLRRTDLNNVYLNKKNHPKNRLLKSIEVAKIISSFIINDIDYVSNTEIEINGGKFARMV